MQKGNVTSFGVAVREGYEPGLYNYNPDTMPLGQFEAVLNFKTWSKRIIAINCYFTLMLTKEKIVVTVYCDNATGRYRVNGSMVEFRDCATGTVYKITVSKSPKGRIVLTGVEGAT